MRRATAALLGTLAGTALLVGAKYAQPKIDASRDAANPGPGAGTPSGADSASDSEQPSQNPSTPGGAFPVGGNPPGQGANGTRPPAGTPARSAATACKNAKGSAVGIVAPGTGTVTVTIKVCNGAVTTSSGVVANNPQWQSTNDKAIPQLNTLAVQYYKTNLSKITYSGATLTAKAYQSSLQSAMANGGVR